MSWARKPVLNNTRWFKDIYSYSGGPWIPFIFVVATAFFRFSSRSFFFCRRIIIQASSSQRRRHAWEQTKRSIPDVEGGNWPDFQRRLNPRLSDSRPSLVGKRRRLSKSWHRPDWNFPCTIDSSDAAPCVIFWELFMVPQLSVQLILQVCTI